MSTPIYLHLSDEMAKESQKIAKELGLSRTQFIRDAIQHELERIKKQLVQQAMAKSLQAMREDTCYLKELKELESGFEERLPQDDEPWWQ